ncbi:hypothetical protein OL239_12760 [Arthrobacter sp. ATA002]|uniref:hypothetical protein n=1 Tax=Arthrobacter sp. ATA002 TaxID=2991715 RepID=UPI0022A6AAB3|nr:hypothetical protein [Arthrobacter sp. ATA002]WAP50853.1 hypothetical protein OL239_12760 [Arthrobacter sp. ATA002]
MGFRQVPQHFVELPDDSKGGEHLICRLRAFTPALSGEHSLGHGLAGTKTVKDGAAAESPRDQALMDGAGKIVTKVAAGDPAGLSRAKSADREKPKAVQQRAKQLAQSGRRG